MLFEKLIRTYSHFYYQLLPPSCVLCGYATRRPQNTCAACHQDLSILSHCCRQCAQFLPRNADEDARICGACLKNPPPFDLTHALFPYQPPIMQLIIALKFQHQLSYAQALGEWLTQAIQQGWYRHQPLPDLIIPVPLHPRRLRERGFNQALEIARPIAATLGLPIDSHGLQRTKYTAAQSSLTAAERKRNIANAFVAYRDYSRLSVAVIDDVITTGHTISACCQALKQKGAKNIHVWCCARRG